MKMSLMSIQTGRWSHCSALSNPSRKVAAVSEEAMTKHGHLPPVPVANHSQKGTGDHSEIPATELLKKARINPAEQGQTANIKQNTTNKGFFKGRRVK
jgi:hypothetical protein